MTNNYVNCHSHTVYSMLDGHGKLDSYAERAAELGMPALAITDHGNIHGWVDFYDACNKAGIKPLLGMEAYQARKSRHDRDEEEFAGGATDQLEQRGPYHLTLIAQNNTGYNNIIKMSSISYSEGFYGKPRLDLEVLDKHSEGVIALSGCLSGSVQQALMRGDIDEAYRLAGEMQDIFGKENYYTEVMNHQIPEELEVLPELERISKKIGSKLVPTGDSHYVNKSDSEAHDILLCLSTGAKKKEEDRFKFKPEEFYLKPYDEMLKRFPKEWLHNSVDLAESVHVELTRGEFYFPDFPIPTEEHPYDFFERLVWEGTERRYGSNPSQEVIDRVLYELRVVKKLGFPSYFLVVSDLVRYAHEEIIRVGWGRGSAAGSIISYVLDITNLDPLSFGLIFERFLVPEEVEYSPKFSKKEV